MIKAEAIHEIERQHAQLRGFLETATAVGQRLLAGDAVENQFLVVLGMLRAAFANHNTFELSVLGPLLSRLEQRGPALIDRMLVEHKEEHQVFVQELEGEPREVAARMPELSELIVAHMMAEERTFLSPMVWREEHPVT